MCLAFADMLTVMCGSFVIVAIDGAATSTAIAPVEAVMRHCVVVVVGGCVAPYYSNYSLSYHC